MQIVCFTKSFQDWPIATAAARFRQIGLDGLDLTVRAKGHIEPADVPSKLPAAVRDAAEAGAEIALLTTDITEPTPAAETTLATAAKLGIKRFKLGYYRYVPFGSLAKQMAETKEKIKAVIALGRKHGVLPCVHIHSGAYIPSHGTMLYDLLCGFRPGEVGAYADTLHMALEGGYDGWRQGLDLLAPWLAVVGVKNFAWHQVERDGRGQQRWKHQNVPIADGVSPLPEFIATLKAAKFDGVYSLHSEYKGSHSYKDLNTEGCLEQTARDLKHLRGLLAGK